MSTVITTYIALGSNRQDPIWQVKKAIDALSQLPHSSLIAQSSLYKSKPVGVTNQADFINAVVCLRTQLSPHDLLTYLQRIETAQGRIREQRFGPRTLDLDLLLYGDQTMTTEELTIPHYAMYERDFVLIPLHEIAPDLRLPNGSCVKELMFSRCHTANQTRNQDR